MMHEIGTKGPIKALVTGGSGFVGSALCAELVRRGWEVVALSRRPSPHGRWIQADLCRPIHLDFVPDVVVHAAARSSPWGSAQEFEAQNVAGTQHVLDFCRRAGRPRLIYISTSAVLYRNEHQFGLAEDAAPPSRFLNHYSRTKYAAEQLVRAYESSFAILRPRAVFGPGDTVVFPRIVRAAREGKFPVLESSRPVMADLIYIDTLVQYIVRAVETGVTGTYHLSNDKPVEIGRFLGDVFRRLGLPEPRRRVAVGRAMLAATLVEAIYRCLPFLGEPPITRFGVSVFAYSKTMNVAKCLRDLGPPAVPLEEGVERFVRWQKAQP